MGAWTSRYVPLDGDSFIVQVAWVRATTTANSNEVIYKGSMLVATPGTFGINWAQNASTASNTTLRAGSYLITTLLNTGASANLIQHIYTTPGSFTETVPTGYNTLVIEVWGGSGGGGSSFTVGPTVYGGGGGGSGSYCRTSMSVTGLGGDTANFTVGVAGILASINGGNSSVSSGTLTLATMTAYGGATGGAASSGVPGSGGAAGILATGGTVSNVTGNIGAAGSTAVHGGIGGYGIPGINDGGNAGGYGNGIAAGANGGTGIVVFSYS